ncbi:MAG: DNA polymerase, partial [Nitrososphaera sp.]|nr:DNA polymerase [Nitrososphaera sp.]
EEMAYQLWTKNIRFNANYDLHWEETDRLRTLYLATFPRIGEYMERRRQEARRTGCVVTPTGRVRRVGGSFVDKHVLNQAINTPVQSTAGDITGAAILGIEAEFLRAFNCGLVDWYDTLIRQRRKLLTIKENGGIMGAVMELDYRMPVLINEVHDALLVDAPPEYERRATEIVVETMRAVPIVRAMAPYLRDLPLDVDVKRGTTWGL